MKNENCPYAENCQGYDYSDCIDEWDLCSWYGDLDEEEEEL